MTPAGWTLVRADSAATNVGHKVFYRTASSSEPASYTFTVATSTYSGASGAIVTYRGLVTNVHSGGAAGTGQALTAPGVDTVGASVVLSLYSTNWTNVAWTPPAGTATRVAFPNSSGTSNALLVSEESAASATTTPARTAGANSATYARWQASSVAFLLANRAPNAPTLNLPNGTVLDRNATNRLPWTFSDPDPGDSQSAANLRYRITGTTPWTTVNIPNPNNFWDAVAGTFADGDYEWQVQTADQQGTWGPYCTSGFFTVADAPGAPTILDPISGQTIGTSSYTGVISDPTVDQSEWTLYADNGSGGIDTATVLQGPVTVSTGDVRSHTFTGLANNVPVWWSVRVKYQGLWSQPTQIRTPVSYTPPAAPTVTLTPDAPTGSLVVGITNPAPGAGVPATSYNNIYVDDGKGAGKERVATMLPTNTPWTYWLPVSLRDYTGRLWVEAVATNGTTAEAVA